MKRFVAVLSSLLVLPAFAEVAPVYYDEIIEYSDAGNTDFETVSEEVTEEAASVNLPVAPAVTVRASGRSTSRASRSVPVTNNATTTRSTGGASRAVASRAATTRSVASRATSDATRARSGAARASVAARPSRSAISSDDRNVSVRSVETAANVARVGVRTRAPAIRASATSLVSATDAVVVDSATATTEMEDLIQLTDFCKAQYMECMDNYCNVLDDSQGRCSCSKNIKNYAKTEEALKSATESLQDVAQKIQYIGLSADEISTLFDQTAAEQAMQGTTDSTQLKTDLDKIKSMIVNVKSGTASSTEVSSGINVDLSGLLNFNIDNTGFDLTGLFGGLSNTNTASISNQRGEELYKTATSRCKTAVLNTCQAQGVDIAVVTNSYDLEIDKQCIAYERALIEENDKMRATVRNAQSVLQKARLMVAQEKNAYDLRGCVNALDSCMQDDFVCGADYENCLDSTGKYIVNGEIVIGSTPGKTIDGTGELGALELCPTTELYSAWGYQKDGETSTNMTAWCNGGNLGDYIDAKVTASLPSTSDGSMAQFLTNKIGYIQDGRTFGMCASVLNKCQDYTFENGVYKANNQVVKEYLRRTLTQIKVAQDALVADHAENCITDVSTCLSQNGYSSRNANNNVAINSCRAMIVTCMSVNGDGNSAATSTGIQTWVTDMLGGYRCPEGQVYVNNQCQQITDCSQVQGSVYNSATNTCDCANGFVKDGGVCKSTSVVSFNLNDITAWKDNAEPEVRAVVNLPVQRPAADKFNIAENIYNKLYWCYDYDWENVEFKCGNNDNAVAGKNIAGFVNAGANLYLSIAGSQTTCSNILNANWSNNSGCTCPNGINVSASTDNIVCNSQSTGS